MQILVVVWKLLLSSGFHIPGRKCDPFFFGVQNVLFFFLALFRMSNLTDPFMSHLATQLGYSAGEFQALQLIVLVAFGVVD